MGRRSTKIDLGDPGNYYFTEPVGLQIMSKKPAPPFFPQVHEPVNLYSYRDKTNCRTISIRNSNLAKCPEKIAYLLGEHPNQKEIDDYLELQRAEGFGERAIVSRNFFPYDNIMAQNSWGIVVLEHRMARGRIAKWYPYTVRWTIMGDMESCWAEDLVLIHPTLTKEQLADILEAQGVEDV